MTIIKDSFGRQFSYLRLSITELCNFQCKYCLPNGTECTDRNFLNLTELRRLLAAFSELGTNKIRLTGGEPTLRKDFIAISKLVSTTPGIQQVAFTTNGYRLKQEAKDYYEAGLRSINVSVDSLDPKIFFDITGHNRLNDILAGITEAQNVGFPSIKINATLLKGLNDTHLDDFIDWIADKPITVRFIELMQTGENAAYFQKYHTKSDGIRAQLVKNAWKPAPRKPDDGPAVVYSHPDYLGKIGIIAPYSKDFCKTCNRLRVSSKGDLHLCLFNDISYPLRHLLQDDDQKETLKQLILSKVQFDKKISHFLHQGKTGKNPYLAIIGG